MNSSNVFSNRDKQQSAPTIATRINELEASQKIAQEIFLSKEGKTDNQTNAVSATTANRARNQGFTSSVLRKFEFGHEIGRGSEAADLIANRLVAN